MTHTDVEGFITEKDLDDPWAMLPALAQRLGVKDLANRPDLKSTAVVCLALKDGRKYPLFDLINAVLDRLDKQDNETRELIKLMKHHFGEMERPRG